MYSPSASLCLIVIVNMKSYYTFYIIFLFLVLLIRTRMTRIGWNMQCHLQIYEPRLTEAKTSQVNKFKWTVWKMLWKKVRNCTWIFRKKAIMEEKWTDIFTLTTSEKINFEINQLVIIDGQKKWELLICFHFLVSLFFDSCNISPFYDVLAFGRRNHKESLLRTFLKA